MKKAASPELLDRWMDRLKAQLDLEPLMEGCCQALLEMSGADRCSIMVLDTDSEELVVRWAQGARVKPYGRSRFRVGEGICGWVARSQKPMFSFDASRELRFVPHPAANHGFQKVKAICCVPLVSEGRTVGVINLSSFKGGDRLRYCVRQRFSKKFLEQLAKVISQATLLREAEAASQRWRRLYKSTSESVAQVSHEVRTPLTLILEGVQQVLDGFGGPPTPGQRQILTMVRSQADRMLKLITNLLDLSRIEAGRMDLQRKPLDLAGLIGEVSTQYAPLLAPRRFTWKPEPLPPVYGDRLRLGQVVENLLTNAVKYTLPSGSITLTLKARGHSAELSVADTGVGISKREQRRLFEKFFQTKIPNQLGVRGTGLGLAITKEIIQLHGGTIRVASETGRGAAFTVSIPFYHPAFALTEEFRALREHAAREGSCLGLQVLVCPEENLSSRERIQEFLQRQISRGDKVLAHPEGALLLLSVMDPHSFPVMRQRLEGALRIHLGSERAASIRWGWALIPQEETELAAALALARQRSLEKEPVAKSNP
ncbi:MAG: GAF domain-containing sensor histidine kinase [Candidatus Omnitrophica bacterium]|nr:GAF domain-containing sensor histidine kinase [Candidatus Omnitrophota bacterium]